MATNEMRFTLIIKPSLWLPPDCFMRGSEPLVFKVTAIRPTGLRIPVTVRMCWNLVRNASMVTRRVSMVGEVIDIVPHCSK